MKPPTMYAPAIVSALVSARLGSGVSSPSSNRIMKSTQAAGLALSARTIGSLSSAVSPYDTNTSRTSLASAAGFSRTSRSSRARSLA